MEYHRLELDNGHYWIVSPWELTIPYDSLQGLEAQTIGKTLLVTVAKMRHEQARLRQEQAFYVRHLQEGCPQPQLIYAPVPEADGALQLSCAHCEPHLVASTALLPALQESPE